MQQQRFIFIFTLMEAFVVSARKYRPKKFSEVVGQEAVTTTLRNAIRSGHIGHALLFCGPRGVGKTTCARIVAKTLNCQQLGSDYEACGTCTSCKAFEQNSSFNIHELDAASNNSVEDIRELVARVRIHPQDGQYKIYIIDEVHMLSASAFNAFLKTLEEPPSYAVFILATTEKHKIIPTILSRCQIYEFSRISTQDIIRHLQQISQLEQIRADDNALHIIAQKADGALRDALSMFDRLVDPVARELTLESVTANLNLIDYDYYFRFTDYLLAGDTVSILKLFDEVLSKGFEGELLLSALAEHFRNLLICKDTQTADLLEVSGSLRDRYLHQARLAPAAFLLNAMNIAVQCEIHVRSSRNKRLHIELALLKIALLQHVMNIKTADPLATDPLKKNINAIQESVSVGEPAMKFSSVTVKKSVSHANVEPPIKPKHQLDANLDVIVTETSMPSPDKPRRRLLEHSLPLVSMAESISDITKTTSKTTADNAVDSGVPVTPEMLGILWDEYATLCYEQKLHITTLFRSNRPVITPEGIVVTVGSSVQKNMFDEELPHFKEYVKNKKNIDLFIAVNVQKDVDISPQKPFTQKEKIQRMTEKNPHVLHLLQQFDLK